LFKVLKQYSRKSNKVGGCGEKVKMGRKSRGREEGGRNKERGKEFRPAFGACIYMFNQTGL
jgi:hypothetical protein